MMVALGCGTLVSAPVGAVVGLVAGPLLSLLYGRPGFVMLDLFDGVANGLVWGAIGATAVVITGNLTRTPARHTPYQRVGSFVLGFVASLLAAGGLIAVIAFFVQARQDDRISGDSVGLLVGSVSGVLFGVVAGWRTRHWRGAVTVGAAIALVVMFALGDAGRYFAHNFGGRELVIFYSLIITLLYLLLFTLPYVVADQVAGAWAGAVAGALGGLMLHPALYTLIPFYWLWPQLIAATGVTLLGLTVPWWRPWLLYPFQAAWNTLLLRRDERRHPTAPALLRWHSALWDETQPLPLAGLDAHLLLLMARNPAAGAAALEYISRGPQRWAARAVQIELDARTLERCTSVTAIAAVGHTLAAGDLAGPTSALLRRFASASNDIAVGLTQISSYNQRLVLATVEQELNRLLLELLRTTDPYAQRFQPIARQWRQIVADHGQALAAAAVVNGEIANPYVVGVPLTKHQEIFVGRTDVSARIEQLLQDTNHPPLLLYGQRRMGKTSLLYNLRWLLPQPIAPLLVDLQGPVALANGHASFLYNVAKAMTNSARQQALLLPPLSRDRLADDPVTTFDDWLDQVETAALAQGRTTLLIALDEFEALDSALRKGLLSAEAVLGSIRHVIQHRPRFKLLLAGSHTLDEFAHWSSYLINAQMIHLSYLGEAEARQLVERPIHGFGLHYTPAASQHVLTVTHGHPYLIQLLCGELVSCKNAELPPMRYRVTVADVEATIPLILTRGRQFFADIALHQIDQGGVQVLHNIAQAGAGGGLSAAALAQQIGDPTLLRQTLALLQQRELVRAVEGRYCFQVEIIRRWFASVTTNST
jgi:hypothetical protein